MLGAIVGDIIGSRFEFKNVRDDSFELFHVASTFTDDTILTVATADAILSDYDPYATAERDIDFLSKYQEYYDNYPNRGWGGMFDEMAATGDLKPYDSYGNGSAMRVAPCGWFANSEEDALFFAERSAEVTHNHPEGIKGAKAISLSIHLGRYNKDKDFILDRVSQLGYSLDKKSKEIGRCRATCQETIPLCMALFYESTDFEDAMKRTVLHGGDVDTNACIVGAMMEAYSGVPEEFVLEAYKRIPNGMRDICTEFVRKFNKPHFISPIESLDINQKMDDALREIFLAK